MATDYADELRAELDALGQERAQAEADEEALTERIKAAVGRAEGRLPVTEVAERLKLHRTTLYRVYK